MKIDVAVNAPEAGTIQELLVTEEDTVTVGQDIARMELGTEFKSDEKANKAPKASASKDQPASSDTKKEVEPKQNTSKASIENKEDNETGSPRQELEASPTKQESPPAAPSSKYTEPKAASTEGSMGNREERRVGAERQL